MNCGQINQNSRDPFKLASLLAVQSIGSAVHWQCRHSVGKPTRHHPVGNSPPNADLSKYSVGWKQAIANGRYPFSQRKISQAKMVAACRRPPCKSAL